jgi:signal peptide peptidase SppA
MKWRSLLAWLPFDRYRNPPPVVAVVRLSGIIGRMGPLQRGLSLNGLAGTLETAFKVPDVKAVALAVNSPGGSPVQSALIARRIRALADEKKVPVFAFAEDVAASGGYWLVTAADEIYADDSSIIGSIGVISAGFGFAGLLKRLGVERRVHASGDHKGALDPFQREQPEDVDHLKNIQEEVHESFRRQVRDRRSGKLKGPEDELFSGRFWTGAAAVKLGLIDGIGDLRTVVRARYGEKVKLRLISDARPWWRRRFRLPNLRHKHSGADDWATALVCSIEERLMWNRFGL